MASFGKRPCARFARITSPAWRAGLSRRGPNLNAMVGLSRPGRHRRRREPPEPAQDLLHPAWRRRAGNGARSGSRRIWPPSCPVTPRRAARQKRGRCPVRPMARPRSCRFPNAYNTAEMGGEGDHAGGRISAILNAKLHRQRAGGGFSRCSSRARGGAVAHELHSRHPAHLPRAGVTVDDIAKAA